MTINDPLSPIRLQLMWDRLIAVVEEQAQTLIRTGFSTSTREAGDLSAGVFDFEGNMLAQAVTGTPGHINSMARSVQHFIKKFPIAEMAEGDVFLTNDPWKGTGHLHDFTFVTPAFRNGKIVALFASTCHVVDIGGRGMTSDGRQIYEVGLFIPLIILPQGSFDLVWFQRRSNYLKVRYELPQIAGECKHTVDVRQLCWVWPVLECLDLLRVWLPSSG